MLLIVVLVTTSNFTKIASFDFSEGSDFAYDPFLPGPSSGPVGTGNFS